jgi:hypothetical protein
MVCVPEIFSLAERASEGGHARQNIVELRSFGHIDDRATVAMTAVYQRRRESVVPCGGVSVDEVLGLSRSSVCALA